MSSCRWMPKIASRKPMSYQFAWRQPTSSRPAQAGRASARMSTPGLIWRPTRSPCRYSWLGLLGLDARGAGEILVDARDAPGFGLGVVAGEVGAHAHHRLDGDGLGHHEVVLAPDLVAEDVLRRLEEVADDGVVARHFLGAAAGELDRAPAAAHPAVQLVEELRLQHPLVALAAATEPVDAVAQRAVALAVEPLYEARGELAVGRGERHVLVEVDEVALVDARRRRIDDHEHLGGEILAAPVEDDARHVDRGGVVGPLLQIKLQ